MDEVQKNENGTTVPQADTLAEDVIELASLTLIKFTRRIHEFVRRVIFIGL